MTPFYIRYAPHMVAACALLVVLAFVYWLGGQGARADFADYRTKVAKQATHVADLATKASELARKTEQAHNAALAQVAEQYEERLDAIEVNSERRVADLESGALRLRKHWAGCETNRLSDASARASGAQGQDRLGIESAERVLRAVETLQAHRDGLQAVTERDRK